VRFQLAESVDLPDRLRQGAKIDGGSIELETQDPTRLLYDLTSWAVQAGLSLEALVVTRPSLEDVYLEITEGPAVEAAP
jgi:ABC-2 type transport system ATP-binding protein